MTYSLKDIEGIGPSIADTLKSAGIVTTADLLAYCGSAKGRKDVAGSTGLDERHGPTQRT